VQALRNETERLQEAPEEPKHEDLSQALRLAERMHARLQRCDRELAIMFVLDGTECAVCMNGFGLEGRFHLRSCEHIYHPMCLISFMVVPRRCALYKAPFHECLYELFGLVPYMPSSWECNPENIPSLCHLWGDDLV
jgi:hypothetical protein